jgi:hypothetical protein
MTSRENSLQFPCERSGWLTMYSLFVTVCSLLVFIGMSSKAQEEKKQLAAEVEAIESAVAPDKAADDVVSFIKSKPEPLNNQAPNEWTQANQPGGCCQIL